MSLDLTPERLEAFARQLEIERPELAALPDEEFKKEVKKALTPNVRDIVKTSIEQTTFDEILKTKETIKSEEEGFIAAAKRLENAKSEDVVKALRIGNSHVEVASQNWIEEDGRKKLVITCTSEGFGIKSKKD